MVAPIKKSFLSLSLVFIFTCCTKTAWSTESSLKISGLKAFQAKNYPKAVTDFYQWSRQTQVFSEKQEAKFYLGTSLAKLDLLQIASFPLVEVVRSGENKFRKKALNQLATYANQLDEKALLKYTLQKLGPEDLTDLSKSAFFLNLSEIADEQKQLDKAISWAEQSYEANNKNDEALYQLAALSLEKEKVKEALVYFSQLFEKYKNKSPNDKKRGLLIMNIARAYYQMKDWAKAAEYYRQVPKDHPDYRVALQELSWTLLRSGQLRSALSPLQSLLTPFYSQFFDPETLLLSSSIYIFSCQYDESLKEAEIFEKNYLPTLNQMDAWLKGQRSPDDFYGELTRAQKTLENLTRTGVIDAQGQLPFFVLRTIIAEPDIQGGLKYLRRLDNELKILKQNFTGNKIYDYGKKIISGRSVAAKKKLAANVEYYLNSYLSKTLVLADQISFIKYEALNGQRLQIKDKIAGSEQSIEAGASRDYYAQNGYRYWPFEGEFWRDEIGSFQYVGINRCQK